jgi:poly-gamma-glutamate synthesis protein (capsule biosynthesis protein)
VLSFVGDCTLGQHEKSQGKLCFAEVYERQGSAYFLAGVQEVLAQDDLTIANLEVVLTEAQEPIAKNYRQRQFWMRGKPEYAQILSLGSVEIANLANNHTGDYGVDGYEDTKQALEEVGVDFFGNETVLVQQVRGMKIGFFGLRVGRTDQRTMQNRIAKLRQEGAEVIIANFHGGVELAYEPDATQIRVARQALDLGADAVVAHHPHVLQGMTRYNGKLIAYSLGNFCYGGHQNPSDQDTVILQLELFRTEGKVVIKEKIIPAAISSHAGYNDYRPRILKGEEAERVEVKMAVLSQGL